MSENGSMLARLQCGSAWEGEGGMVVVLDGLCMLTMSSHVMAARPHLVMRMCENR